MTTNTKKTTKPAKPAAAATATHSAAKQSTIDYIKDGKTPEDIATMLYMSEMFSNKAEARRYVSEVMIDQDLVPVKKESKVSQLTTWFLAQEDPTNVTKDQIKQQCLAIGMKGGSIQYYINSFSLAISLVNDLK